MQPNFQPVYTSQAEGVATDTPPTCVEPGPAAAPVAGVAYPQLGGAYNVVPTTAPVVSSVAVSQPYAVGPPQYAPVQIVSPQPQQTYAQPPFANSIKKWCVGCCLTLAIVMVILALAIDMLAVFLTEGYYFDITEICGYKSYKYTIKYDGGGRDTGQEKYSKLCDSDAYDDDWCDTEEKGEAWIALAIVAVLIAAVPLFGIVKLNTKWPIELVSVGFVSVGMLVFYDEKKNICWDDDHDGRNMGWSGVLMIIAIIFWVIAAILRFIPFFCQN